MPSQPLSRRKFIQRTAAALGGVAATGRLWAADEPRKMTGEALVPKAVLGRTGELVSRLGIGGGFFGTELISVEQTAALLHRAVELGVNYIDTAPRYESGDQISEEKIGGVFPEWRDKFFLVTKVHLPSYDEAWRILRQSLKRLRTDHLDLVHVHGLGNQDRFSDVDALLSKQGAFQALREAKKSGVIRFIGVSGHRWPNLFHRLLDTGEVDVLMNAVNFVVQHTYDFEHKVWNRARHMNLGLVAMKVLGGQHGPSKGFRIPGEYYESAIRYALSIPGCATAVIGMKNIQELEEAARCVMSFTPLTDEESHRLARLGLELARQEQWEAPYGRPLT